MRLSKLIMGAGLAISVSGATAAGFTTVDLNSISEQDLAVALSGEGLTISNVTYSGANGAAGLFFGGADIIGIDAGVILSSGKISHIGGPNLQDALSWVFEFPGDPQLDLLSGFATHDAAILEFDFVPDGQHIEFLYVFGSEEYNEHVNSEFNDVFAFFINGVNCAVVPGTNEAVSVNSINNGVLADGVGSRNSELFINNDLETGGGLHDTEMDGFTMILDCPAQVMAGATNHAKLVIADSFDMELDSWVFIKLNSFEVPVEERCREDGLILVRTTGVGSKLVHSTVEPLLGDVNTQLTGTGLEQVSGPLPNAVHDLNCSLVVPLEDAVDVVTDEASFTLGDVVNPLLTPVAP